MDLLRAVYKDLLASGFPERYGLSREGFEKFFVKLAAALGGPSDPDVLTINTDGATKGNPGPAAIGFVIRTGSGSPVRQGSRYIGIATSNEAEYRALLEALTEVARLGLTLSHVAIESDSDLLVRQVKGEWRTKHGPLRKMLMRIHKHLEVYPSWEIRRIGCGKNLKADELAHQALQRYLKE